MNRKPFFLFFLWLFIISCNAVPDTNGKEQPSFSAGSFGYDLQFLQQHDSVIVLRSGSDKAQVIVSPGYQGKVFTSTADGLDGYSFGWINYKAFTAPPDEHMNAYGGENRFWLGPEGGPFSVFFQGGNEMVFANWKTPPPIDSESWTVKGKTDSTVTLLKDITLRNYAGTLLQIRADRHIKILDRDVIQSLLGEPLDTAVKTVGYQTINGITNAGEQAWNENTGAPCIWILDMFKPSSQTTIVIPFRQNGRDKIATTDYFGEIPADRIKFKNEVLFFKADGNQRGKLGLSPLRAKPIAGSYDAALQMLTLTFFDVVQDGKYLNQEWTTQKPPYSGDAINAYNDGPLEDGSQMGPFYEIESVSPAAFLQPGGSLTHHHSVVHLSGSKATLDRIARKHLGASLDEIQSAF